MSDLGLFDGAKHVGTATLPPGREMPGAVVRGREVFVYFQQSAAGDQLNLEPGEGARFLKVDGVLWVDAEGAGR